MFAEQGVLLKWASSPFTSQVLVHTKVQQATTTKTENMQFHLNSSSVPPSICGWFTTLTKAEDWQQKFGSSSGLAVTMQVPSQSSARAPTACHSTSAPQPVLKRLCHIQCKCADASECRSWTFVYVLILDYWSQQKTAYWLQWELDQKL